MSVPMSPRCVARVALAVVASVLAAGCAAGSGSGDADEPAPRSPTASVDPTAAAYDPGPWQPLPGLGRCGPQPPRLAGQRFEPATVRRPGLVLPAVTAGRGRTVAVLLHQTDGNGFCGWLPFAQRVAQVPGQTALALDLCGYGRADCAEGSTTVSSQVAQVRAAIDFARDRLRARRVVLVGASMGGSLAVLAAARDQRVDAVVDLSGPDGWSDAVVHEQASRLRVPVLVAMADSDGAEEVAAARALAEAGPSGSVFVGADSGHGYELLEEADGRPTELAGQVLDRVAGR